MSDSKNKNKDYSWIALIFILLIVVVAAVWYFRVIRPGSDVTKTYGIGEFRTINRTVISELKGLRICGNWPLNAVNLSTQRGNPFARKNLDISPMAASSSPECLLVSPE